MGKKDFPVYKIVAADSRSPRDGKFIDAVGLYDPKTHPITIDVKEERVIYWLKNGAQPTPTVRSLLKRKGITLKFHLMKKGLTAEEIQKRMDDWSALHVNRAAKDLERKKRAADRKKAKKASSAEAAAPQTASASPAETAG
jgi:small subunit ribosomal protein S16